MNHAANLTFGLVALVAARVAAAQNQTDPATDPALNDPRLSERARDLERPAPPPALTPTIDAKPVPPRPADPRLVAVPADRAPLRREGSFLVRQPGSLVRLRSGDWMFVFHRDPQGAAERPMILLESEALARLESMAGQSPEDAALAISGQVFLYRGVNYLLVSVARPLDEPEPPEAPTAPPPDPAAAASTELDEAMRALEAHRARPSGMAAAPIAGDSGAPLSEGSMLVRRRARLARVAAGRSGLLIDSDADTAPGSDPAFMLAPCAATERMEQIALAQGESVIFEVTGRVLAYGGRNYLLPILYQVYPGTDLHGRQ